MKGNQTDPLPSFLTSPSIHLPTTHVTTTPNPHKIVKKSARFTKIAQKMTKNARFLQIFAKK
jgi:hypothetical protein